MNKWISGPWPWNLLEYNFDSTSAMYSFVPLAITLLLVPWSSIRSNYVLALALANENEIEIKNEIEDGVVNGCRWDPDENKRESQRNGPISPSKFPPTYPPQDTDGDTDPKQDTDTKHSTTRIPKDGIPPHPIKPKKLHGRFLHISDIHPDRYYKKGSAVSQVCHRNKPKSDPERAGYFGVPYR